MYKQYAKGGYYGLAIGTFLLVLFSIYSHGLKFPVQTMGMAVFTSLVTSWASFLLGSSFSYFLINKSLKKKWLLPLLIGSVLSIILYLSQNSNDTFLHQFLSGIVWLFIAPASISYGLEKILNPTGGLNIILSGIALLTNLIIIWIWIFIEFYTTKKGTILYWIWVSIMFIGIIVGRVVWHGFSIN